MRYLTSFILLTLFLTLTSGTAFAITPTFQHYFPTSDPSDTVGTARTFTVIMDQSVTNASWYVNGTLKQRDTSGYILSYTNSTAGTQNNPYNVTVTVIGNDGNVSNTTSHMWNWTVNPLALPGISSYGPLTNPSDLNTSSRTFNITVNQTGTIKWYINSTLKQTDATSSESSYTNSTAGYQANPYNVTVNFTGTNGTTYRTWAWTRTVAPTISAVYPIASSTTTTTNANFTQTFNLTADRTTNVTYYLDDVQMQFNQSVTIAHYNNSNGSLGTHTVTAITNNSNGTGNTLSWTWVLPTSTMSIINLSTNLTGAAGRAPMNTNYSLNFSWTDTGNITTVNLTFNGGFNFSALLAPNITSNIASNFTIDVLNEATQKISLYNKTGKNNSGVYVNFTSKIRLPAVSGNYIVTVTTNKNTTGTNFTVYARNVSRPYFVNANNSVFTIGTETFGTLTTTIPLTGKGLTNLTINAPNISSTVSNITAGYGATNASKIRAVFSPDVHGNYTLYVETDPTVTDPIIIISYVGEMEPSNLPTGLIVVAIAGATIIYIFKRRRH